MEWTSVSRINANFIGSSAVLSQDCCVFDCTLRHVITNALQQAINSPLHEKKRRFFAKINVKTQQERMNHEKHSILLVLYFAARISKAILFISIIVARLGLLQRSSFLEMLSFNLFWSCFKIAFQKLQKGQNENEIKHFLINSDQNISQNPPIF